MLPFMIKWYRERFPNCLIIVYDNESTDRSVQIALENNCKVISYSTNNQLSDSKYLEIKNNCWKTVYRIRLLPISYIHLRKVIFNLDRKQKL